MSTASIHDMTGKCIELRLDKRVLVRFPYSGEAERKGQIAYATSYIKEAIKKGSKVKLKPGVEVHVK